MPYAICITGPSGPEKDEVISGLAREFEKRGVKAAAVLENNDAIPEKGVTAKMELGPGGIAFQKSEPESLSLESLMGRYFAGVDLVLTGAHPGEKRAKVLVALNGAEPQELAEPGLRALVGEARPGLDKPAFGPGDFKGLADFLEAEVIPQKEPAGVRVVLGGKRLPIKDFVQDIIANTIRAMIASLKGGDRPGRLEIYIDRQEG